MGKFRTFAIVAVVATVVYTVVKLVRSSSDKKDGVSAKIKDEFCSKTWN